MRTFQPCLSEFGSTGSDDHIDCCLFRVRVPHSKVWQHFLSQATQLCSSFTWSLRQNCYLNSPPIVSLVNILTRIFCLTSVWRTFFYIPFLLLYLFPFGSCLDAPASIDYFIGFGMGAGSNILARYAVSLGFLIYGFSFLLFCPVTGWFTISMKRFKVLWHFFIIYNWSLTCWRIAGYTTVSLLQAVCDRCPAT